VYSPLFMPFDEFRTASVPQDDATHSEYRRRSIEFIEARNRRIDDTRPIHVKRGAASRRPSQPDNPPQPAVELVPTRENAAHLFSTSLARLQPRVFLGSRLELMLRF
jgi:hypothetical protein